MASRAWRIAAVLACLWLGTAACSKAADDSGGGGASQPGGQTGGGSEFDLTGTWAGEWSNTTPDSSTGGFTLTMNQTGSKLGGAIVITGTPCLTSGAVSGTIDGDQISFGAVKGSATVEYKGAVTTTTMTGTYTTTCGNAEGTWGAKLTT